MDVPAIGGEAMGIAAHQRPADRRAEGNEHVRLGQFGLGVGEQLASRLAAAGFQLRGVEAAGGVLAKLPQLPEMQPIHEEQHEGALSGHTITDWRPEDPAFWEKEGRAIARRNLWLSIPALLLAFAVWMVWSVVVARLPQIAMMHQCRRCAGS